MAIVKKFTAFGSIGIALWLLSSYILITYLTVEKHLQRADAIVVLGGSADFRKRTQAAANLWREGAAPKVIVTDDGQKGGWDSGAQRNPSFVERAVWNLKDFGVDSQAIEVPTITVYSTHDEAELISDLAVERNYRSIILVTSRFHTRRALWTFDRVSSERGAQIIYGIEYSGDDDNVYYSLLWTLDPKSLRNITSEALKLLYYWNSY